MCCKNGGAFVKVGQHLGSLEYLLPIEYVETMKILHDKAPQSDLEDLKKVFYEDLGKKVNVRYCFCSHARLKKRYCCEA